jgi:gliding motility-associated lipoprotein GldH
MKALALLLAAMCTACTGHDTFCRFHSIGESIWHKDSVICFEVAVHDTLSAHNVSLELRTDDQYPYKNLWLFISLRKPSGEIRRDTLECQLADDNGKWYGTGISLHKLTVPYDTGLVYPQAGIYTYTIAHAMRNDRLPGISEVGLRILR